ncbi:unnamed protein product [Linum trigynum]|uniref:Integrase catalytic domain-containing protein n=1 Tax=Linum trigynum TaxID=586398 RepID=A0AAV2DSK9_9ROSI
MDSGKPDAVVARFDGKNFPLWEFQFRTFVQGKRLLPLLLGTRPKPAESEAKEFADWEAENAQVITWLVACVDVPTGLSLRRFTTASAMWKHLCTTNCQANASRQFALETAIAGLAQGRMDIRSYYQEAMNLWTESDLLSASISTAHTPEATIVERTRSRTMHFLMKLRPEYEPIRASLLHRNVTELDEILAELYREEIRLKSQAQVDAGSARSLENSSVFAATSFRPHFQSSSSQMGASGHGPPGGQGTAPVRFCHYCRDPGHIQPFCRKRNWCNFCRQAGHILSECPKRGRRSHPRSAGPSSAPAAYAATEVCTAPTPGAFSSVTGVSKEELTKLIHSALQEVMHSAFSTGNGSGNSPHWLLDSAAFNHMTNRVGSFTSLRPVTQRLQVADGTILPVTGMGRIVESGLHLDRVLHAPRLVPNLISVGQLAEDGCDVKFDNNGCVVQDSRTGMELGRGRKHGRIYVMESLRSRDLSGCRRELAAGDHVDARLDVSRDSCRMNSSTFPVVSVKHSLSSDVRNSVWDLWHCRLGHPHSSRLLQMFSEKLLPGNFRAASFSPPPCISCIEAKAAQRSFPTSSTVYDAPFDLVHTDLWGPSQVPSRNGFLYFALFIDHHTWYTWIYFLRHKSELLTHARDFVRMIQTQFQKTIKIIRSDPGGEFSSNELLAFYRSQGILSQQSCPGVSQQNGVVERKNRHVLELTRALLFRSGVPARFWVEAANTVVHLINRQITPVLDNSSPYQKLYSKLPDYGALRVFGCLCFVLLPRKERHKLDPKTARCVFLGYSDRHKGYLCYDPEGQRLRIGYHVIFMENVMYYSTKKESSREEFARSLSFLETLVVADSVTFGSPCVVPAEPTPSLSLHDGDGTETSSPVGSLDSSSDESSSSSHSGSNSSSHDILNSSSDGSLDSSSGSDESNDPPSPPAGPRRSDRVNKGQPPPRHNDYVVFAVDPVTFAVEPIHVPSHYRYACGIPEWDNAMIEEIDALEENETWEVIPRTPDMSVVGCKWVFTVKLKPDGSLDRYKARLVAQGFSQEYGIDYDETFAPVAKMQTVRCVLAVAAMRNWPLVQLDVKNAFLHGDLKETIYMACPAGYSKGGPNVVCRLKKSLYGLKQAPRTWFEKFHGTVMQAGFVQSQNDPSLFLRQTTTGLTVLLLYVDDMIITGSDHVGIQELKETLHQAFKLKELGDVSYFLGLEIERTTQGIFVSQKKYVRDLLVEYQFLDCKPCPTPMEQNLKLSRSSGELLDDQTNYRTIVGSLRYLSSTRPDIAYAVQVVSQYMGMARTLHLDAVHRILRYLQGTQDVGIFFPSHGEMTLEAFADADFAGCVDTRRSTSGWCVRLGLSPISWRCKKQDRVSKSSTEAEYRSMSEVSSELVWLQRLLMDLGVNCTTPMRLFGDNTSAIRIANNPVLHDRTKHIETHVHYIRQLIQEGVIQLSYLSTEDQTADLLTKAVGTSRHWYLSHKLMLRQHHQFEGGC